MSFRAGYVGLIGQPNAGKSTLLNALVGEKVAIVSPKPQTTRQRVVGIYTSQEAQICFSDAPGLIRAEKGLHQFLAREFHDTLIGSDVLVAVLGLDEKKPDRLQDVAKMVSAARQPWILVVTKADLPLAHRLPLLRDFMANYDVPLLVVSAETNPDELRQKLIPLLVERLPVSPGPLFDADLYTPHSTRDLVAELIREQGFLHLHHEIPFGLAVKVRQFSENSGPKVKIAADLIVSKENHRPIVIGGRGQKLKAMGQAARGEIEKLLGRQVYLNLHVVTQSKWMENPLVLKELGYVQSLA